MIQNESRPREKTKSRITDSDLNCRKGAIAQGEFVMEENTYIAEKQPSEVPQKGVLGDIERDDNELKRGDNLAPKNQGPSKSDEWHFYSSKEKHLAYIPVKYRKLYQKAWEGHSRKAAIRVFCLECVAWLPREVELCTGTSCALYQFRLKG